MTFKVTTPVEFSEDRIASLIISAFEGGSNYWYLIDFDKSVKPSDESLWTFPEDDCLNDGKTVVRHVQWPMSEGGRLFITNKFEDEGEEGFLDRESIQRGLQVMAEKYPKHFADFIAENDDGNTGDVFLQCAVLGQLVYG
jgi:hypothetical protein